MKNNEETTKEAIGIMNEIDKIVLIKNSGKREAELKKLKDKAMKYSLSTVCEKRELEFPLTNKNFRWFSIAKTAIFPKF